MYLTSPDPTQLFDLLRRHSRADTLVTQTLCKCERNVRFANNTPSTNGTLYDTTVTIHSHLGHAVGSATTNNLTESELLLTLRHSEEIAQALSHNQEYVEPIGTGYSYPTVGGFDEATHNLTIDEASPTVARLISSATEAGLIASGYVCWGSKRLSLLSTGGLSLSHLSTSAVCTFTARDPRGSVSGKSSQAGEAFASFDLARLVREAFDPPCAQRSSIERLIELPAQEYVTILSPEAVADLLVNLLECMDQRSADEGRSYFSLAEGKTRVGQSLCDSGVRLYSDPTHARAPCTPFAADGYPLNFTEWISNGALRMLWNDRYWAMKQNLMPCPKPRNLVLAGGESTLDDLIRTTEYGLYVHRLWYIRMLEPRQALLTGLTRDGVYLIEGGKIQQPVKNFRFNDSPVRMLQNIQGIGQERRALGSEGEDLAIVCPPLKLSRFGFSSVSEAV